MSSILAGWVAGWLHIYILYVCTLLGDRGDLRRRRGYRGRACGAEAQVENSKGIALILSSRVPAAADGEINAIPLESSTSFLE